MEQIIFLIAVFTLSWVAIRANDFDFLPTLYWDDENPLFQCKDPLIRMAKMQQLDVHCPNQLFHNYLRKQVKKDITKIRMVQAKDEEHYNKCNTTDSRSRLYCEDTQITDQTCNLAERGCSPYYNIFTGLSEFRNVQGTTLYFIGVSDNGDTGVCQGQDGRPPMKFKIYVCTDKEKEAGQCEPCTTEACYYQQCSKDCGDWVSGEKVLKGFDGNCYEHRNRICKNQLTSSSTTETVQVQVNCPVKACGDWEDSGITSYKKNKCVIPQQRICTLEGIETIETQEGDVTCPSTKCHAWETEKIVIKETMSSCYKVEKRVCLFEVISNGKSTTVGYHEERETNISCPTQKSCPPPVLPQTTKSTTKNLPTTASTPPHTVVVEPGVAFIGNKDTKEDINKYIYMIIGSSVGALILGIMIGYCLTRLCQRKQAVEVVKTVEKVIPVEGLGPIMSYDNKNFTLDPVLEDSQSFTMGVGDIAFIPATQEVGTTKRQVMVARSVSFYNPDANTGHYYRKDTTETRGHQMYRPPRNIQESRRNVMRHPSATSKSVLIRNHSDATERPRSDSDTSVFNLKAPEDMKSEEV